MCWKPKRTKFVSHQSHYYLLLNGYCQKSHQGLCPKPTEIVYGSILRNNRTSSATIRLRSATIRDHLRIGALLRSGSGLRRPEVFLRVYALRRSDLGLQQSGFGSQQSDLFRNVPTFPYPLRGTWSCRVCRHGKTFTETCAGGARFFFHPLFFFYFLSGDKLVRRAEGQTSSIFY